MSTPIRLTDAAITQALALPTDLRAPMGLSDQIRSAVAITPQRRGSVLGWRVTRRRAIVLRLALVAVALLVLGGLVLIVGSRRPPVVPPPPPPPTTSTYHGGFERNGLMPGPAVAGVPSVVWHQTVKGPMGAWSPVVLDGMVVVADRSGYVSAFNEVTGDQLWQQSVGAPINAGITVNAGLIIVGDDAGVVHALPLTGGAERWRTTVGAPVHSAAVVVGGTAFVGTTDGRLWALDAMTGMSKWAPVVTAGPISRAIAASGDQVFVGSGGATPAESGTLQAYDATTGALRWAAPVEPGNTSTPSVAEGVVFVTGGLDQTATGAHDLFAFNAGTGKPAWVAPFRAPSGKTLLVGAVAGGQVFALGTDGSMYVLDAVTGSEVWGAPIGSRQSPSAGVVNGSVYVTSDDRTVHAFDIASRQTLGEGWPIAVAGVPGSPAIVDGRIFVGTSSGEVLSIGGSGPSSSGAPLP